MTATLFCVPLQTYRVLPDPSKQSALGLQPNGSDFSHRVEMVSTTESVVVSMTLSVSLLALASDNELAIGRGGHRGRDATRTAISLVGRPDLRSTTDTLPSLAIKPDRIERAPCLHGR